jgi:hypothetical protein
MPPIKRDRRAVAIETRYKGYRFRSRLEARWAVFFDALGVPWEYEKQGFDLGGFYYLPDFWLPDQRCWVEIKGEDGTDANEGARRLADAGHTVYLFIGSIPFPGETFDCESGQVYSYHPEAGGCWDNGQQWCECRTCGRLGIRYKGRSDRLPCKECYRCAAERNDWPISQALLDAPPCDCRTTYRCPLSDHGDRGHTYDSDRLMAAYQAARSARFEHGEMPRP